MIQMTDRQAQAAVARVRTLHRAHKIYDMCSHSHTDEELQAGACFPVEDVGLTCADGLLYVVCHECCTDDGYQTEECGTVHEHDESTPRCSTIAALERTA